MGGFTCPRCAKHLRGGGGVSKKVATVVMLGIAIAIGDEREKVGGGFWFVEYVYIMHGMVGMGLHHVQ